MVDRGDRPARWIEERDIRRNAEDLENGVVQVARTERAFGRMFAETELCPICAAATRLNAGLGEESGVNIYEVRLDAGEARVLVSTAPISLSRLLGPLLHDSGNPLSEAEQDFLDRRNNQNERYDVGDTVLAAA